MSGRGRAAGARGSALLPAVAMLALLALAAAMSLLAGEADLLLAVRTVRERAAVLAAEGALATALEELAAPGAVGEECLRPPHPPARVPARSWRDGGWRCRRSVSSLPDGEDADADVGTTVVLFDRSFGYGDAPRATGGFPVLQVVAAVESGETRGAALAEVTPVSCLPQIAAAWTTGGSLALSGSVAVAGSAGGDGGDPVPAILARGAVSVGEGAAVEGGAVVDPGLPLPAGPLAVLGAGVTLASLDELPPPAPAGPVSGVVWARGDWTGPLEGEGILVVHNPAFDPVLHEASRLALEEGVFTEAWDASYSHLDDSRRPAELRPSSGGDFRGVVIADAVAPPGGAAQVTGALVTLGRSPLRLDAGAPFAVRHSQAAIARCGRGPLRHLTAWRVLPSGRVPQGAFR